jgi:chromate transporter
MAWLALFVALLLGLPWAAAVFPHATLAVADAFYRAGSLVLAAGMWCCPCCRPSWCPRAG